MLIMIIVFTMTMFTLNAQMHKQESNLTIYSEEGDKFFLFLNGECQNNIAQNNLRIEDLELPTYTIKIAFTDKRLEQLTNKQIQMQDVEGRFMEVTYRIKKDKKTGIPKLKLYAMEPAQNGYVAPADCFVIHKHHHNNSTSTTETTVTQTTTNNNADMNINMGMGGVNLNMSVSDPNAQSTTTTTTTTTTSSNNHHHYTDGGNRKEDNDGEIPTTTHHKGCSGRHPMDASDFSNAFNTIKSESFNDTKLTIAKQIAESNCLSTNQIIQICKDFNFEDSKLDFAKFAFKYCTDKKNYYLLNSIFNFSDNKKELSEFVQQNKD